jgi:hypothetical protein
MLWKLNFITILISNSITEFEQKIENKNNLWKLKHSTIRNDTLPYRCQPQKWLTPGGRERTHLQNNIKVKPQQLKLNKTDPSTWS